MAKPVDSILIVGSGFAAWASAALLARATGGRVAVSVVADAPEADSTGDEFMASCRPEVAALHDALGIDEPGFMRATGATFKLATRFSDWSKPGKSYLHGFGDIGARLGATPFYQLLNRVRLAGAPIPAPEECSLAAMAASAGRFAHPVADKTAVQSTYSYGYHFDVAAAASFLRAGAQRAGARLLSGHVRDVNLREDGFLQGVTLDSGEQVSAQLFVDCSGMNSRLLGQALGVPFESWRRWLPCDRVVHLRAARAADPAPLTDATARAAGWQLKLPLQKQDVHALFFASDCCTDDQAARELAATPGLTIAPGPSVAGCASGRRREFWVRNCVAIGTAGAMVDPVGGTSAQLVYSAINRLISLFPHADCGAELAREFNRITTAEHERARDFALLHFHASSRADTPFWRECRSAQAPDVLEYRLKLFMHAGRLAAFDDELFTESDWVSVLLGQDVWPQQADPLTLSMDVGELVARTGRLQQFIQQAAQAMPPHRQYLERMLGGNTRPPSGRAV